MIHPSILVCLAMAAMLVWAGPAPGAIFVLTEGGRIVGELENPDESPRKEYVIKTAEGSVITLDRAQVKEVIQQRPEEAEYEKIRPRYADTPEKQWELAEWCRERNLVSQRKAHLQRVIELSPDHAQARAALGYSQVRGQWTTQKEAMTKDGYRWYQGRWRLPQEIELIEERRREETTKKDWMQKINRWLGWLEGDKARLAKEALLEIEDPKAVPGLAQNLKSHPNPRGRAVLTEALSRLGTTEALQALALGAIEDTDEEVRLSCLDQLKKRKDPAVIDYFCGKLKDKDNIVVNRAAFALQQMGNPTAIGPLIEALATTHKFKISSGNPGQMSTTFGMGPGGSPGPGGLAMGGGPKIVHQRIHNRAVLDALVTLSGGVNYQFDVDAWRAWHASQRRRDLLDARRG